MDLARLFNPSLSIWSIQVIVDVFLPSSGAFGKTASFRENSTPKDYVSYKKITCLGVYGYWVVGFIARGFV